MTAVTPPQHVGFRPVGRSAERRRAELVELYRELHDQHGCPLAATRTHVVFGMGNADADLMFVGEAPGATEDQQGKPFVGRAGKLLDTLLEEIGLSRGEVFIANILMCRPPGNRDPLPEEIEECTPYLLRKIELIEPRVIATLGNYATKFLTRSQVGITRVRGVSQEHEIGGLDVQVYPLFHPAAALRTSKVLEQLRDDMSRLPALLAERSGRVEAGEEEKPAGEEEKPAGEEEKPALAESGAAAPSAQAEPAKPPQLGLFG